MKDIICIVMRVVGVMIGLGLFVAGYMWNSALGERYEHAPHCAPGEHRECIATVTVVVVKRYSYTDSDSDPFPHQPPPMPPPAPPYFPDMPRRLIPVGVLPAAAVAAAADLTAYKVTVRMPDGRRRTLKVDEGLYDKAKPGVQARAEIWRGHLIRLTVEGESKKYPLPEMFLFPWLTAWTGVMLAAGAILYPLFVRGLPLIVFWAAGALLGSGGIAS